MENPMKKLAALSVVVLAVSAASGWAQQPPAAAAPAAPGASPAAARPQTPPATGAMLDLANQLAEAINKGDAAALQKMMADDAVYLDEDGHAPAVARWIGKITTNAEGAPPKKIEISSTHGGTWENTGWVSFNYVVSETFKGEPKNVRGTASLVARKGSAGDWKIQMIHGALYQRVEGLTDAK
jgi:ketosteroid isomerase-like protein